MIERSIAVVSGKGGAGKTMLAMAITHELAIRSRTLIVDLDVFNRGLSGLLQKGRKLCDVAVPDFLLETGDTDEAPGEWSLIEAAPNVVTLHFPDITRLQRQRLEELSIGELMERLDRYVAQLLERSGCRYLVLDCHGGPDMLSFAAAGLCQRTILVSEPDRITFYGTLHFLRRMAEDCPTARPDVYLVFNKVMPAFSERYLNTFYDEQVKDLFQGHPLLAVIPFEAYLSKEFERFPFVTQVYPFSQLAGKARIIVRDLKIADDEPAAKAQATAAGRIMNTLLGRGVRLVPRFMNLDATTSFTAPVLVAVAILAGTTSDNVVWGPRINQYCEVFAWLVSGWFVEVMLVNWLSVLDRIATRQVRLRKFSSAIPAALLTEAIGLLLAFMVGISAGYFIHEVLPRDHVYGLSGAIHLAASLQPDGLTVFAFCLYCATGLWVTYNLVVQSGITLWHERRRSEGVLRGLGSILGPATAIVTLVLTCRGSI